MATAKREASPRQCGARVRRCGAAFVPIVAPAPRAGGEGLDPRRAERSEWQKAAGRGGVADGAGQGRMSRQGRN